MKRRGFLGALIGIGVVGKTGLPKPVEKPVLSPVEKDYLKYANLMQNRPVVTTTMSIVEYPVYVVERSFPTEMLGEPGAIIPIRYGRRADR